MSNLGTYPVVIVGAGPSGSSASMYLNKLGIPHCIIDASTFPRDKICGDAISGKVTSLLRNLDPAWEEGLQELLTGVPSWGVLFSAPSGAEVSIPFRKDRKEQDLSPGYIIKREVLDAYLNQHLDGEHCTFIPSCRLLGMERVDKEVVLETDQGELRCQWVLSGEGSRSMIARKWAGFQLEKDHYCAGIRVYYEGIADLSPDGVIELHFVKEALPGYFWIFPLANGQANVGIGMLSKDVSKRKVDLKEVLNNVIESERFKERFANAHPLETPKGWGLPLGSKKRPIQGDGFLLLGDSASLIDPFTGEGIGNGMISGRIAAECLKEAWDGIRFDTSKVLEYQDRIYAKLWGELRLSRIMQRLIRYPWLLNAVLRKIRDNRELRQTVMFMFEDVELRKKFSKPSFYFRVLFGR